MLEFDDEVIFCLYISDMALAGIIVPDDLLPILWEPIFPSAVPNGFRLPPSIAISSAAMRPMPNPHFSATREDGTAATRANASETRFGLTALVSHKRVLHTTSSFVFAAIERRTAIGRVVFRRSLLHHISDRCRCGLSIVFGVMQGIRRFSEQLVRGARRCLLLSSTRKAYLFHHACQGCGLTVARTSVKGSKRAFAAISINDRFWHNPDLQPGTFLGRAPAA